jgi:hypothetical protein
VAKLRAHRLSTSNSAQELRMLVYPRGSICPVRCCAVCHDWSRRTTARSTTSGGAWPSAGRRTCVVATPTPGWPPVSGSGSPPQYAAVDRPHRRPARPAEMSLARVAGRDVRPDGRTHPRHHRRADSRGCPSLGGQEVSGCRRHTYRALPRSMEGGFNGHALCE